MRGPREKVELLEYEWEPDTGIATLRFSNGETIDRDEPTRTDHFGWRDDFRRLAPKWPTRSITVGDRVERPDGTAYYV